MKARRAPGLDARRTPEFSAELRERARAWIPSWALADGDRDFGRALLEVAARFSSEVAERLDRAGEKMQRGFLDWLGVRGEAARPARMPVVFKLVDAAREAVFADAPIRMQVDAAGASVIFETETDVRLLPGRLVTVVGVDAAKDEIYLTPPGLNSLEPLEPLPTQWQLKSFAPAGAKTLQVDPEAGLAEGLVVESNGQQYRIEKVDNEIITVDPPLTAELPALTVLRKVTAFAPYDGITRNRQEHALYLGHKELLEIESAANIAVVGASALREGVTWQYWGKAENDDEVRWRTLTPAEDQDAQPGAVVLTKPKGAIEESEIGARKSRWIRAWAKTVDAAQEPFAVDELSIGINPFKCGDPKAFPPIASLPSIAAEGMANTTPLVLGNVFLPLGREPRQFDAFYLGCTEAFAKPGARVQLHFEMGDPSFESLAYLRSGPFAHLLLAGVAGDGHLYLLTRSGGQLTRDVRGPLRPPSPGENGLVTDALPVHLDSRPAHRPAVWWNGDNIAGETNIAVSAGDTVWVWRNVWPMFWTSGWQSLGVVGPVNDPMAKIDGIVHLADGLRGRLFALRDGKLFRRDLNDSNATWEEIATEDGGNPVALQSIVAIAVQSAGGDVGPGTIDEGLAGIGDDNKLYAITDLLSDPVTCVVLLSHVSPAIAPAAVRRTNSRLIAAAVDENLDALRAFRSIDVAASFTLSLAATEPLAVDEFLGGSIDVNVSSGVITFALTVQDGAQSTALVSWTPFVSPLQVASISTIPSGAGTAGGAPSLLPGYAVVPAVSSQLLVAPFNVGSVLTFHAVLETAIVANTTGEQLQSGDHVAIPISDTGGRTDYQRETVIPAGIASGGETLYPFHFASIADDLFVARAPVTGYTGTASDPGDLTELTLDPGDTLTGQDTLLLITTDVSTRVYRVPAPPAGQIVHLDEELDVSASTSVTYERVDPLGADLRPLMHLTAANNNWPVSLLARTKLMFPDGDPQRQSGKAFQDDGTGHPLLVVLQEPWNTPPLDTSNGAQFLVDATVGDWSAQLGDPSSNPALSWEYANGTGWWKLDPIEDQTLNLKRTGNVWFTVPADLRPMDWAGRTNCWIRARLVGGDYGKEIVTVKNIPGGQTIERSTAGIQPPQVLELHIAYKLCATRRPDFVLAQDSGSMRDQSEANRTRGAIVEAFVPLSVSLGRLDGAAAARDGNAGDDCPPPCDCAQATTATAPSVAPQPAAAAERRVTGRALFIGLDATPSGEPVNVLLLVDRESPHEAFAPMRVDALIADRFVPIAANDTTRALGESGLVSMSFSLEPTPRELFGFENLTWLRLTPAGTGESSAQWTPSLRGAYLNAVFASAAETLTRELLGSSEGAPDLTLRLQRPPVLRDSLELRVREPLGEEERIALLAENKDRVRTGVEGLPGDWVLWDRVIDPGDEDPAARVYALDEAIGEVRFGDGQHGMIPPIGRDSIVAFTYRRTEVGGSDAKTVPANSVGARTALNLVSPVDGVEAVFAADRAAGGAPPESAERVVRFGTALLRHRKRAITARDFEDLALQSSPDIVQARCFVRGGVVRLIIVMRGANPIPDAAQVRELRRLLLDAAPSSLRGALQISGPRVRRLRIVVGLRVATLDDAGDVSRDVQARIAALFDTATGGIEGDGWAVGMSPADDDIALTLLPVQKLEGLGDVQLREVLADGSERPWSGAVKRDELVMLDKDAVRREFETVEVIA